MSTRNDHRPAAVICRDHGWKAGTCLEGDEGYGPSIIRITAVGERQILAREIAQDGVLWSGASEASWCLSCRDWREVEDPLADTQERRP